MRQQFKPQEILKFTSISFVTIFLVNFLLQGLILRQWNDSHMSQVLPRQETLNMFPLLINYLIQAAGLVFIVRHFNRKKDYKTAAQLGALYGLFLFLNLGFTLMFIFPQWPVVMVVSDTLATMVVYAASALAITYLDKKQV